MSLETELKKIGNNLQQLTDAVVTLTAEMQTLGTPVVTQQSVELVASPVNEKPHVQGQEINPDRKITESIITENDSNVVDINAGQIAMDMATANLQLQGIVAQMADGGVGVRKLLAEHNAITLAQIPPENYASFVEEARALVPVAQS